MIEMLGQSLLAAAAAFGLLTAWMAGASPAAFANRLGLAIANPGGRNEVRAQYAGFFFAVALACLAALEGAIPRQAGYAMLAVVFGGLFVGRVASLGLDRGGAGYTATIRALHLIDAVGLGLAVAALLADRP